MTNKQPKLSIVFDRRKVASISKKGALEIRIAHNYKQKYISTGIMLYSNQWKRGKIVNCPDMYQISCILDKMIANIRQTIMDMMAAGNIDINAVPEKLSSKEKPLTFIDFCIHRASIRKFGKEKDTQERYDRFIRLFTSWGKIQSFEDVKESTIILYDKYLTGKKMKPYSKWNNYHRFLNSFITDAVDEGILKKNPYKWLNIDRGECTNSLHKCLSPSEFRVLKSIKMPTESLERVRDIFVFQTYTCLSYTDLSNFDASKIQEVKGAKVYIGKRQKTNKPFTIPILSPAWSIITKYNGKLPLISNTKYNEYLKVVAQAAGIDKPISTHWARHTGATLLLNEGIPMQIVSKICGHSTTRITEQVYAKLLDETVVDAVQDLDI